MIHAFKPDPVTNIQDSERFFDFCASSPESFHMVTFIYSPWGIPANYRMMQGSGVNTYKWVNNEGKAVLVKYHWEPKQGIRNLTQKEAEEIQAKNFNHATQDLYEAIEKGDFPEWELLVQMMSDDDHPELDFDPLDDTKLWPEDQFPWKAVGKMVLNRNPEDYFTEVEQAAFGTGVLVDGLTFQMIKCYKAVHFHIPIHNVIVLEQTIYSFRSMHRKNVLQPIKAAGKWHIKLDRAPVPKSTYQL